MKISVLCVVFLIGTLTAAKSVTVWDNGMPDYQNAFRSDFANNNNSTTDTGQVGDDFTLGSATTLNGVQWWGVYAYADNSVPATDNFTIRLFTDVGGNPSSAPFAQFNVGNAVNRTDTGNAIQGFEAFSYSTTLPNTLLPSGTYLLSIVNDSTGQTNDWFWATSNNNVGDAVGRTMDGDSWMQAGIEGNFQGFEAAFNLSAVPEPSTWAVAALTAVSLVVSGSNRYRAFRHHKA